MKKEVSVNMTEGNIARVLLAFALPIFISNLFQQLYNVVDIAVIGHVLGDDALAAVGATSSLYSLVIGFINGMSNGFSVVLSRFYGAGENGSFRKAVNLSIFLSFMITILLTFVFLIFLNPMLRFLNTPEDIMGLSINYISIILAFCFITFAYNLLSAMMRAVGNSRIPLYALIIASCLNVLLDLLLIGGFSMGVAGAAYATVIAQAFSVLFLLGYIVKYCPLLHISRQYFRMEKDILMELFTTGISMAMMLVLTNIGTVAMQGSVNSFGTATITGHTAARKFHDLCMLPFGTICTSTATFVSQNFGAKEFVRIKEGIKLSLLLGAVWSLFVLTVTVLFGRKLIQALTGTVDANVLSVAMQYLYWNVPFYILLNGLLIMRNSLQALGSKLIPITASLLELVGKFAGVFWLVPVVKYLGICWIEPITWIVCLPVVMVGFVFKVRRDR
ncbi:MAG: MATE family efflux transporter [Lachnospiraceae bacterium]|nr:MATE family efflux transporter [Lachnospiraceae bacterium]